jgi:hypothetical protein
MSKKRILGSVLAGILTVPALGMAAELDASKPLICAVTEVLECTEAEGCERRSTEEIAAPEFLRIDAKKKTLTAETDEEPRTSPIERSEDENGVLVLQGGDDGRGWTMAITIASGEFSGTVAGQEIVFVVFGNCTTP